MTEEHQLHYHRHSFPAEIIAHAVWFYYRFPLSFRDVEDLLAERDIEAKFSLKFAYQLRRRSCGQFSDKWYLDEMMVSIKGKKYRLWRAVDANGYVLDALLQSQRACRFTADEKAAESPGTAPSVMITDKLRSYSAAKAELMPGVEHRSHKGLNNRRRIRTYPCEGESDV